MKYIFLIITCFAICFSLGLLSDQAELDAAKIELIEVSASDIRLVCFFENATITTYFRKSPRKNFFFSIIPTRQEFLYYPTKQVFNSKNYENRLWDDGVAGYSFTYEDIKMAADSKKFTRLYTTINDQCGDQPFEARYTLSGEPIDLEIFEGKL
ncbi:hypothetical protein [Parachlamydia acanthamoebae]|jgi:hypothetical protein|uniref:hypothetical protein n=1 Tax=Parachlamydia acanthamoebae TaxID=83552 RepID=UPI0024E22A7E|nr:hypothetical protein [Parachlamydia acanthamoebae]